MKEQVSEGRRKHASGQGNTEQSTGVLNGWPRDYRNEDGAGVKKSGSRWAQEVISSL